MKIQFEEQVLLGRKRRIRLLAGLFIGLLIVFTLLSNTIMSLTMPKVIMTSSLRADLTHTFISKGMVKWRSQVPLRNAAGGKVEKIQVEKGQQVKKGQTLIVYDQQDAEQHLLNEKANLAKLELVIEKQQNELKLMALQNGDELALASAIYALKVSEIDLDTQQRRIKRLQQNLTGSRELTAPFDGIVTDIHAIEGMPSSGPEIVLANQSSGFQIEFTAPRVETDTLEIGGNLTVHISGEDIIREGLLADIQRADSGEGDGTQGSGEMKRVLVTLPSEGLQGGERAQVELTRIQEDVILIPSKAIHVEGYKNYVLGIEAKNGPLGNTFYARRIDIKAVKANEMQSVVSEGLFEQQQMIMESSEPLQDGDKVRVH